MYKKFIKTIDNSNTLSGTAAGVCAAIIISIFNIELFKTALNFKIPIWLMLFILGLGTYFLKGKLQSNTNSMIDNTNSTIDNTNSTIDNTNSMINNKNILDKKITITVDEETNLDNITLSKDILCYSKDVFQDPISKNDIIFTWNYSINNKGAYPVNIQFLCPYCNEPMDEFTANDDNPHFSNSLIVPNKNEVILSCESCEEHFIRDYDEPPSKQVSFSYEKKYYYDMIKKIEDSICTKVSKLKNT